MIVAAGDAPKVMSLLDHTATTLVTSVVWAQRKAFVNVAAGAKITALVIFK
jgi:hypothetical protein